MSWVVAFTKKGCEHLAKWNLENQGYEAYLPLSVGPGTEAKPEPFFPRYVFVNTEPVCGLWRPVMGTRGVCAILKTGEAPSYVPARVIDGLRRREEAGVIRVRRIAAVQAMEPGQIVRVHEGNWTGFEGVFERPSGEDRVFILLDILGGQTSVEVLAEQVAKVA